MRPNQSGSCASLLWRWHVLVSAESHTGSLGMGLLGKWTQAPCLWCHWTHTENLQWAKIDRHAHECARPCCRHYYLLLSQNLMTLFWLLCRCVSIMRLKRVSFCSFPSITIRPRKNQWRLCSLGRTKKALQRINTKNTQHTEQSRQSVHCRRPHLLDWARSKHSTLVGFLSILWNIDV